AGGSSWEIAALLPLSQAQGLTAITVLRAGGVAVFTLLSVLLTLRYRQFENNQALKRIIFRNERFLRAVETVSQVGGWRWSDDMFTELSTQTRDIMMLPRDEETVDMPGFCFSLDTRSAELLEHYVVQASKLRQRIDQELELRRREGRVIWLHLKAEVMELDGGRVELIGAIQDITQQKKVDQLIEYQANYDSLTGLPNRGLFQDRLHTALLHAKRRSTRIAILFVDLDNFKSVNDNLGHDAGDELLVESAQRIQSSIRTVDTVARYSGVEFVAILADVFSASVVSRIADDIVLAMRKPFVMSGRQVYCSVSIGVAFYPDDGESVDTLVIKADQAMYEVKKAGRNSWQFYTIAMQLESEQKHHLYNELVVALEKKLLTVFYQPIVDAVSGRVSSCEALVRWQQEDGSWVAPDTFIPVAEERGLINRIDLLVLQSSLRFVNELNASLSRPIALSVNVSPRVLHMRDDDAQDWLRALEQEKTLKVTIEITERVLVEDSAGTHQVLDQLHQAGVQIAIDDFGTGYSGLSYFSRFPVSAVKIDRSFVQDLELVDTQTTLVETILLLARKLDIEVVAEGVETAKQAEFLRRNHCDYLQGYHISRPLSEEDFRDFVTSRV
ncbi:MAG: EAL domain-containing protein, partial [Pseudohongiella sp.]